MKKMFKAVATLAVGCALLSTSAFAADPDVITGVVTPDATGAQVVIEGYETSAQATILVVKDTKVNNTIPENLPDGSIAYINQVAVSDKKASYDVNVTGDGVYSVFAGGSDVAAATFINSFEIKSVVNVTDLTLEAEGLTAKEEGSEFPYDYSAALTVDDVMNITPTVVPGDATDKTVTWTASNANATVDNGVVTAVAAGDVVITAKAGDVTKTIAITISEKAVTPTIKYGDVDGDGELTSNDCIMILKVALGDASVTVDKTTADVDCDGELTSNDCIMVLKVALGDSSVQLGPTTN